MELVAAVQSTAEAARQANINKSEKVSWTTIENDQVEAALQAEASSLREELGERKYQVEGMDCLYLLLVLSILRKYKESRGNAKSPCQIV